MEAEKPLLTCPHCESEDVVDVIHWVECKRCGARGPTAIGYDWNSRAAQTRDSGKKSYVHRPINQPKCGITGW